MTKTASDQKKADEATPESKEKKCFVIMPIADMEGYEPGHFARVYEHLIMPACSDAGYVASRADFVTSSNYIIIDILQKILDSDLVICDLSGRNPNVLYELGIRQAFNLPTVLIKDAITPKIFDIQGLRYTEYNHTLRVDEVKIDRSKISGAISGTTTSDNDVNSLIQLLSIKPATRPDNIEVSTETGVILKSLKEISDRIATLESAQIAKSSNSKNGTPRTIIRQLPGQKFLFNGETFKLGETVYIGGQEIGSLIGATPLSVSIKTKDESVITINHTDGGFSDITGLPF